MQSQFVLCLVQVVCLPESKNILFQTKQRQFSHETKSSNKDISSFISLNMTAASAFLALKYYCTLAVYVFCVGRINPSRAFCGCIRPDISVIHFRCSAENPDKYSTFTRGCIINTQSNQNISGNVYVAMYILDVQHGKSKLLENTIETVAQLKNPVYGSELIWFGKG